MEICMSFEHGSPQRISTLKGGKTPENFYSVKEKKKPGPGNSENYYSEKPAGWTNSSLNLKIKNK